MTSSAAPLHLSDGVLAAAGYCQRCGRAHALPRTPQSDEAVRALVPELLELWRQGDPLFCESRMVGVLVGEKAGETTVLRAFSGAARKSGWAEPPLPAELLPWKDRTEKAIGELTDRERELRSEARHSEDGAASILLERANETRRERRRMSRRLMTELTQKSLLTNFRGDSRSVADAFLGAGIPSGTGECCAPKLLGAAVRMGIRPLSMAEMWWVPPGGVSPKRAYGSLSEACASKCEPILGFLLCGVSS